MCGKIPLVGSTLDENSRTDKPWTLHRRNNVKVSGIYAASGEASFLRYSERMSECASWLEFGEIDVSEHDHKLKLTKAHFCRVRHCPICAWRKTLALMARFQEHLPAYLSRYSDYAYLYVVLTVKNPVMSELRGTIALLNDGLKKLLKRKEVLAIVNGFVKTVEVTRGNDGNPHPHLNLLLAVNKSYFTSRDYLRHDRWVQLWRDCLRVDYDPQVHVAKVKRKKKRGESFPADPQADLIAGFKEVVKYSVKESDLIEDPDFLLGLTRQVAGLRFVSTGGCLKGILSKDSAKDGEEVTDQEMMLQDESSDDSCTEWRQSYSWGYDDSRFGQYYFRERYKKRE